ncbi:MAG: hypothetical protein KF795_11190, partial [Labilithrix sp.]|nr:hypothetical protein [Labilithrix sp.]
MKRPYRFVLASVTLLAVASCRGTPPPASPPSPTVAASPARDGAASVGFAVVEAPLTLTASDGTGLRLAALNAQAVVDGPLAFTELRLAFENPLDRTLEGTFRIALPQGASLGRFAMKIDGAWQEGEVVELEAARRAYEDFLHRKQDPALMEKSAGNEFSARVFPIPPRGVKEIVVAYVEERNDGRWVLPLRGLPELGDLTVDVRVLGAQAAPPRLAAKNTTPTADYVVDVGSLEGEREAKRRVSGVRNGELAILRVRPQTEPKAEPLSSAIVLVDTSASRALGFDREVELVGRVVKRIAEDGGSVTIACFDQTVLPVFEGRAADVGPRELAKIRERGALGASDLERALAWAGGAAKQAHAKRVVLVSDGVATAGATDPKKLLPKVAALRDAGVDRIDAVALGGIRDDVGLQRIVRGNLARDGVVVDATREPAEIARRLGEATRSNIAVKVEGATWAWPSKIDGAQAGDAFSIYAEVPAGKELRVSVDGAAVEAVATRTTERPLVERAVGQAKVASMLEREATSNESLKKSIVSIATRQRIMTPYTAMLVLETEQDYARYGIDRRSLADVLAIQDGNVRRLHRDDFVKLPLARPSEEGYGYELTDDAEATGVLRDAVTRSALDEVAKKAEAPGRPARGSAARPQAPAPRPPPPVVTESST